MTGAAAVGLFLLLCWVLGMLAMAASEYRGLQESDRTFFERERAARLNDSDCDGGAL